MAVFRVEKNKNYTVMANYHLKDKSLSLKAKGLLSIMLSLPDNWDYTLNGLATINKDGVDSVRTTVIELEKAGYIVRQRSRNEVGHLTDTEYTIFEQPQLKLDLPILENPTLDKPILDKPTLENPMQLSTKKLSTNELNTNILNTQSINPHTLLPIVDNSEKEKEIDKIDAITAYKGIIKDNIDYESLCIQYKLEKNSIDQIVDLMTDIVCSTKKTIRIGGDNYSSNSVKSRFLKIDFSHIEYVLNCLSINTTKIYNIKQYLLTALYNAPTTIDHYYRAEVNHDMQVARSRAWSLT